MKKLYFTIALLLASLGAVAQNIFFVGFDQRYSEVLATMQQRSCVEILEAEKNQVLVIEGVGATFTYRFNQGWLYRVDMARRLDNRKLGRRLFEESQKYFETIRAQHLSTPVDEKEHRAKVFARTGRIFHLSYQQVDEKGALVTLTSTSTVNRPVHHHELILPQVQVDWSQSLTLSR